MSTESIRTVIRSAIEESRCGNLELFDLEAAHIITEIVSGKLPRKTSVDTQPQFAVSDLFTPEAMEYVKDIGAYLGVIVSALSILKSFGLLSDRKSERSINMREFEKKWKSQLLKYGLNETQASEIASKFSVDLVKASRV